MNHCQDNLAISLVSKLEVRCREILFHNRRNVMYVKMFQKCFVCNILRLVFLKQNNFLLDTFDRNITRIHVNSSSKARCTLEAIAWKTGWNIIVYKG